MDKNKKKIPSIVTGILSAFIWGLGQLFNRQYVKALIFFASFALLIFVELATSSYGHEFDIYEDKIAGDELEVEHSNYLATWNYWNLEEITVDDTYVYTDVSLLIEVAAANNVYFDEEDLKFYANEDKYEEVYVESLVFSPDQLYEFIGSLIRELELEALESGRLDEIDEEAKELTESYIRMIVESDLEEIADRNVKSSDTLALDQETEAYALATQYILDTGVLETDENFSALVEEHYNNSKGSLFDSALINLIDEEYNRLYEEEYEVADQGVRDEEYVRKYNGYYNDLYGNIMLEHDVIRMFKDMFNERELSGLLANVDNDDYNRMLTKIYFAYADDNEFVELVESVYHPVHENAGFFVKGLWGMVTLGEIQSQTITEHDMLGFLLPTAGTKGAEPVDVQVLGHHSIQLLLRGFISVFVILYSLVIYIWNVRDAYKTRTIINETGVVPNEKEYFADVYKTAFEYIVLTPSLLIVSFITLLPIIFSIAIAFTNYNKAHLPPGNLVDWVGFRNFINAFSFVGEDGPPFGEAFFRVLWWTIIWAVFSTFTCFFGGFIQAVILNNERVGFRKFWRSLLILPWAMPAIISQMVFSVMFSDAGFVNQTLNSIGVYDILIKLGMLGRSAGDVGAGISRLMYLGENNIQWITNTTNPTFVKVFLIFINIWLGFPFFMALMSGVMTSIDKSLYEAAEVDGATGWQKFRFITTPMVLIATSPLLIMAFSGNFNNFGMIYFVTGGGPGAMSYSNAWTGQTDILISWIYRLTTQSDIKWYNMASVFSIFIFLMIATISTWNFTRTRAFKED